MNDGYSAKRARPNLYSTLLPLAPLTASYSPLLQLVSLHRPEPMRTLWHQGFFGKGALSRSDPAWRTRVLNALAVIEGGHISVTSEEMTARRRIQRGKDKAIKKMEREDEKLLKARAAAGDVAGVGSSRGVSEEPEEAAAELAAPLEEHESPVESDAPPPTAVDLTPPPAWHLDAEYMQLQSEEAFFLQFALGTLSVVPDTPAEALPFTILQAWSTYLLSSPLSLSTPSPLPASPPDLDPRLSRLDSPFLLSYAAYHHFRSMGWVVRSGVKFCTDWVLYGSGGPVGGHAEFAVVIMPTYADPADELSSPFREQQEGMQAEGERKGSWRWFNTVNRVCSGVKKTLVLLYVVIPPLSSLPSPDFVQQHPAQALAMLQMREVTVRRWIAGRSRD